MHVYLRASSTVFFKMYLWIITHCSRLQEWLLVSEEFWESIVIWISVEQLIKSYVPSFVETYCSFISTIRHSTQNCTVKAMGKTSPSDDSGIDPYIESQCIWLYAKLKYYLHTEWPREPPDWPTAPHSVKPVVHLTYSNWQPVSKISGWSTLYSEVKTSVIEESHRKTQSTSGAVQTTPFVFTYHMIIQAQERLYYKRYTSWAIVPVHHSITLFLNTPVAGVFSVSSCEPLWTIELWIYFICSVNPFVNFFFGNKHQ